MLSLLAAQVGYWVWFGVAWVFILAVLFKHWFKRERRDQAATDDALNRTRPYIGADHYEDAL
jgi:hypothetical protein